MIPVERTLCDIAFAFRSGPQINLPSRRSGWDDGTISMRNVCENLMAKVPKVFSPPRQPVGGVFFVLFVRWASHVKTNRFGATKRLGVWHERTRRCLSSSWKYFCAHIKKSTKGGKCVVVSRRVDATLKPAMRFPSTKASNFQFRSFAVRCLPFETSPHTWKLLGYI